MSVGDRQIESSQQLGSDFVSLVSEPKSDAMLVCFHFAGGSAQSFLSWRQSFNGVCDLVAAELPGRSRRFGEDFTGSIMTAAESFAASFEDLPNKKCIFYGHSLGALLAYETARVLARKGKTLPIKLVVSSRSGPVTYPISIGLPELSDSALMSYLHALKGTQQSVLENKMLMEMMLPIIRSDLGIIYSYQHQNSPVLDIPIDVIGAIDDGHCPFESLLDWKNATSKAFRLTMIEGGHFAPLAEPENLVDIVKDSFNSESQNE